MNDTRVSMVPESSGRQPTLDFLRGLAILSVVAFHAIAVFKPGNKLVVDTLALGFQGVQLFFLVSALTMCYMWDHRLGENHASLKFYIRRIFRIAPPFWLAILGYLLLNGSEPSFWAPAGIGVRQVITNLFFVSGFAPDTMNSVVPGGWSIIDEMTFYAFFPLLITRVRANAVNYAFIALLIYIANLIFVQPLYGFVLRDYPYTELYRAFMFQQFFYQAPIFLLGIFLYKSGDAFTTKWNAVLSLFVFLLWLGIAFVLKYFYLVVSSPFFWLGNWMLMAVILLAFRYKLSIRLVNKFGQLSYSIYLTHFAVILAVAWCLERAGIGLNGPWAFMLGTVATLALCWCLGTFLAITLERISARLGKRVVEIVSTHEASVRTSLKTPHSRF